MTAAVILVDATPRRAIDGIAVPVRLAGGGGAVPYHYGGEHYRAGIAGLPKQIAALDFDGEQLGGGGVGEALELRWAPARAAALTELAGLFWTDAPITVRIGAEGAALPPVASAGLVLDSASEDGALRIAMADGIADLKRPLLIDRFAGTGGVEGPAEWEGRIKSRAWGRCFNVPGQIILPAFNIVCFGDPRRAWQAFDQVRTRGVAIETLTVLAWQGSVEATFAALIAVAVPAGSAVACPSIACVKWWTAPEGDLYADIRGELAGGYVETAPAIAARIIAARSALTINAAELADAVAARPAPFGWRVATDSATAAGEVSDLLGGVSLSWPVVDGQVGFRRWEWGASRRTARSQDVTRRQVYKPVATRKLGYRRNWSPMARGDLAAIVLVRDVVYEDGGSLTDAIDGAGKTAEWPQVTDPDGTKPADNADVTGENTSKDTNAVGGTPAIEVLGRLTTLETETIPTVESAVAEAGGRITAARAAADAARVRADQAIDDIAAEIDRALGSEADIHQRIDSISASGGYDDTAIKVEVKRVDETAISRDAARGRQIDAVSVSLTQADSDNRAETKRVDEAAVSRDSALTRRADEAVASINAVDAAWKAETSRIETQAVNRDGATNQRIDDLVAEGGGGSEGVDSVARAEIRRVETASVSRDGALGQRIDTIGSSIDTVDSRIAAKAQEVTTAYTRLTDALASRSTLLEASASAASGAINPNQDFRVWPAGQELPTGYGLWGAPAGIARAADGININNNNQEGGIAANVEQIGAGWYVYEAQVYLHTYASFLNTGLTMNVLNDAGQHAGAFISHHFYEDAGHGAQDRWYHFSRLVQVPDLPDRRLGKVAFHAMGRWASFSGGATSTNNTTWRFARVRPASDAEIKAGKADATLIPALSARIKTTEDTLVDLPNRYATAQRASNIEAAVNGVGGRVSSLETVTSNGTFATAQRVDNIEVSLNDSRATVSQQAGAIAGLNGKAAAYVRIVADAGNGRAALSLWSDQYGGAWQLVGNGIISGDLTVDGTITARKFNGASMAREVSSGWSGSITPASGQTVTVPWSLTLPSIPPTGRFIYEYVARIDTNAGTSVYAGVEGGKPVTIHYVDDGGLTLRALDSQGNVYTPRPNASDLVLATTDFAPSFTATMRRGSRDERVDGGDFVDRYVSANYTLTFIDLKATWVAI